MKKKTIVIIILIIAVIAAFVFIRQNKRIKPEVVRTTEAVMGDIETWLSTNALVQSRESKDYFGATGLTVKKIYFKTGDPVKTGDVILEYDLSDLETSVKQAKIQYDNSILNRTELLNQKKQIEDEMADLDADILRLDGSKNPQDIANMQSLIQKRDAMQPISDEKVKLMDNSVELAKLGLDSAQDKLDKVKGGIISDSDGVITALNAVADEPLSPSQPAATIKDLNNLKCVISLGKYDAVKIKLGQKAVINYSGNTYDGVVSFINPAASKSIAAQDATLQADIDIKKADEKLKIDFDVDADILVGEVKNVLKLPVECITYDKDNNSFVYLIVNGKALMAPVKLGLQSDTEVEVLEGVRTNDKVIMNPPASLSSGALVAEEGAAK